MTRRIVVSDDAGFGRCARRLTGAVGNGVGSDSRNGYLTLLPNFRKDVDRTEIMSTLGLSPKTISHPEEAED